MKYVRVVSVALLLLILLFPPVRLMNRYKEQAMNRDKYGDDSVTYVWVGSLNGNFYDNSKYQHQSQAVVQWHIMVLHASIVAVGYLLVSVAVKK